MTTSTRLTRRELWRAAASLTSLTSFALLSTSSRAMPAAAAVARRYAEGVVLVGRSLNTHNAAKTQTGQGFFVSSAGLLCSVLPGVKVADTIAVSADVEVGVAHVVAVDADGLCLAQLTPGPSQPVTALGINAAGKRTRWLIGLSRSAGGVSAVVGGEEEGGLLVPVPRGAPILNEADEVVAVCLRRRGGGSVDVIASPRIMKLAATARG